MLYKSKKIILIFIMLHFALYSFTQSHTSMKIYVMPFSIIELDGDWGKPLGYKNDNYVRVHSSYQIVTSHIGTIEEFIKVFFEPSKDQCSVFLEPKYNNFEVSNKYKAKYFEPYMVIDFFHCEKGTMTVEINQMGYFCINYLEVFQPDKKIMDFLQKYFPPNIVSF